MKLFDKSNKKAIANYPSFCIASIFLVAFAVSGGRYSFGFADEPTCYGFIRDGGIVLNCRGETTTSLDLAIEGFAVSSDGNWLALKRVSAKPGQASPNTSKLISLISNSVKDITVKPFPNAVLSSCGRILVVHDQTSTFDPVLDMPSRLSGYSLFRCSADQRVTIGYSEQEEITALPHKLWAGRVTKRLLSDSTFYLGFDISPSGEFIAFEEVHKAAVNALCLAKGEMSPHCLPDVSLPGPVVSVSDTGHVLFEQSTEDGCFYRDGFHFSRNSKNSNDACVSIYDWTSEQTAPKLVADLGRSPQWIPNAGPLKAWLRKRIKV